MRTLGPYRVDGEIARGAMGVVYRGYDPSLDRPVAIKVLLGAEVATPEDFARFRVEAKAIARLRHPNIVRVQTAGEANGQPFLVMDYIDGGSLQARLKERPLDEREAARIAERVARALHYAHERGILHRDVKPHNVLIDQHGEPVLTDFGLAKARGTETGITLSGELLGTPVYMPPEQANAEHDRISTASDMYSLGATLYAMLTGEPPFRAANQIAALEAVLTRAPEAPSVLRPGLDPELEAICLRCLRKEPAQRYESALQCADALKAFSGGPAFVQRPARSKASPVLVALGLFGVLGSIPAATAWQINRLEVARLKGELGRPPAPAVSRTPAEPPPAEARPTPVEPALTEPPPEAQDWYDEAIRAHHKGDPQAAIEAFTRALDLYPNWPKALYERAYQHNAAGNHSAAIADSTRALELEPGLFEALQTRAQAYIRIEDLPAARADLDQAVALTPYRGRVNRASLLTRYRPLSETIQDYEQAVRIVPAGKLRAQIDTAIRIAVEKRDRARALAEQASDHARRGEYGEGLKLYAEVLSLDPGNAEHCESYANVATLVGDFRGALQAAERMLLMDPNRPDSHLTHALALLDLKRPQQALEAAERCLRLQPKNGAAIDIRGQANFRLGNYTAAIADFDQALSGSTPARIAARVLSNRGRANMALENWAAARDDFSRAIERRPDYDAATLNRGFAKIRLADFSGAREDLLKAAQQDRDRGVAERARQALENLKRDFGQ